MWAQRTRCERESERRSLRGSKAVIWASISQGSEVREARVLTLLLCLRRGHCHYIDRSS